MYRFENMVTDDDLLRIQEMFMTMFILSYHGRIPSHIILDCDDTNVDTYGCQEQSLFNGYYDNNCHMPLMVFEGYSGKMIKASILTIREKLMLYAVSVRILKSKACIDFVKNNPMNTELIHAVHYYNNRDYS